MIRNQGKGHKPRPKSPDHRRCRRRRGSGGGSSVGALKESGGPIWQCHPLPLLLALLVFVAAIFANYLCQGPSGSGPLFGSSIPSNAGTGRNLHQVQDAGLHRTQFGNCVIHVVELGKEKVFECELDPADARGETGVTRAIDASPEQLASLEAMLDGGELVPGKTVLDHGPGAEFDDETIFLPPDASVMTRAGSRRLNVFINEPGSLQASTRDSDHNDGTWVVEGSERDITNYFDQFFYVRGNMLAGDVAAELLVLRFDQINRYQRGGIMIRQTEDAGSKHFSVLLNDMQGMNNGLVFDVNWRESTNGITNEKSYEAGRWRSKPVWLRVTKMGDTFSAAWRFEGDAEWETLQPYWSTMSWVDGFYVGIAITSHVEDELATLEAKNFTVEGQPYLSQPSSEPSNTLSPSKSLSPTSFPSTIPSNPLANLVRLKTQGWGARGYSYADWSSQSQTEFQGELALQGFSFDYLYDDHHLKRVGVITDSYGASGIFHDNHPYDQFNWHVSAIELPLGAHRHTTGTHEFHGGCDRYTISNTNGDFIVLSDFDLKFKSGDHQLDRVKIWLDENNLDVCFADKNNDDPFTWRVDYVSVPKEWVYKADILDEYDYLGPYHGDLPSFPEHVQPVITGFSFDLTKNHHDQHVKMMQVWIDLTHPGNNPYWKDINVVFKDKELDYHGDTDKYTWHVGWVAICGGPCRKPTT